MLQFKNIVLLLLIFCAAFSCKKRQPAPPPTVPPKTGIHKMEGKREWKGTLSIGYDWSPWHFYPDTSYEITFSNTIYVLDDSTVTYSPDYSIYKTSQKLFLKFLNSDPLYYYFAYSSTSSRGGVMYYYYKLDSFCWVKYWTNDSNQMYNMSVHSP